MVGQGVFDSNLKRQVFVAIVDVVGVVVAAVATVDILFVVVVYHNEGNIFGVFKKL